MYSARPRLIGLALWTVTDDRDCLSRGASSSDTRSQQRPATKCNNLTTVRHLLIAKTVEIPDFSLPHHTPAFDVPLRGVPVGILPRLVRKKLEWFGYPTAKKTLRILLLVLTEYTNVTDRHTQRDGMLPAALMNSIARQTFIQRRLASRVWTEIPLYTSYNGRL